ncbi:MAG: hypothetical protein JKY92_04540 [Magnetovibrio sp.]|nr:hypothetical protein [Magnetovibrio sp.]
MKTKKSLEDQGNDCTHARSRAMAEAVVAAFSGLLKDEAQKHGGFLGLRHLEDMEDVFHVKAEELSIVFEKALQDSHREQEDLKWHAIKRPAFDRLMVKHFENLFFSRGANGLPHGVLSRRVLPGFFLALNMMLGPEAITTYQVRCDEAMERVMNGKVPVDWDLVEKDPDVHAVVLDALYTIAQYFNNPFQRADWFIQIVNSNLAPARAGASDAYWRLDQRSLFKLVSNLLLDLKKAIRNDVAWTHLALRHEGANRDSLKAILRKL